MNEENSLESVEAVLGAPGKGMGGSAPVGNMPGAGSAVTDSVFGGQKPGFGFDLGVTAGSVPKITAPPTTPKGDGTVKTGLSALRENLKQTLFDAGERVVRFGRNFGGRGGQRGMEAPQAGNAAMPDIGLGRQTADIPQTTQPAEPKVGGAFAQSIGTTMRRDAASGKDVAGYMYGGIGVDFPEDMDLQDDNEVRRYVEESNSVIDTFNRLYMED